MTQPVFAAPAAALAALVRRVAPLALIWAALLAPGGGDGGGAWPLAMTSPAAALDMDLRQPLFTQPRRSRAPEARRRRQAVPRHQRAPAYQPPPQRGFFESLFGAPQRPQYQPGYRPQPPETRRRARPAPGRAVRRAPPAETRPPVVKTDFVYLLGPASSVRLTEGLEAAFADRPIVGVRPIRAEREAPQNAGALLAPLPADLAGQGQSAFVVVDARPEWAALEPARLRAMVEQAGQMLAMRGAPVVWVGLPPAPDADASLRAAAVNGVLKSAALKTGGGFADAWAAFADDSGGFAAYGPTVTGENARLRQDADGALTRAGARKLAHFIALEVRRLQASRPGGGARAPADPFLLPGPQKPAPETAPETARVQPARPAVGPVLPLNQIQIAPGAALAAQAPPASRGVDPLVRRTLELGVPADAPPGRADDFRWPRKGG